jgi:hypothetical protein
MTKKIFALVVMCCFIASIPLRAAGAQGPAQSLSPSICATSDLKSIISIYDFDSPNYKGAAETVPAGVKSYLAQLLIARLQACTQRAGPAATACSPNPRETDPHALWEQLNFCEGALGLDPVDSTGASLVAAQEPTIYVVLGVGAGSGGPPGGQSASGGSSKGGGGSATGSTATGSSVDNPAYFLLFLIAQRLERDVCTRSGIDKLPDCDAQHPVAVVPETTWNLEDLRSQCANDPYVANDPSDPYGAAGARAPAGHGTIGAILLNGSIVTADGTFAVLTVYGSSEANYTAQVVQCSSGNAPFLSTVWSDSISDGNKTTALSFFPLALAGTLIAAHSAAKEATMPQPNPSASPNVVSAYLNYQTDVALGTFAANASTLTLGNPSSGLTLRHAFEAWTTSFVDNFNAFCGLASSQQSPPGVCKALKLPAAVSH